MNLQGIIHSAKSSLSYPFDDKTLHIRLKTAKDDVTKVTLKAVDPFNWVQKESGEYVFDTDSICVIPMVKEGSTELYDIWFAEVTGFKWQRIRYGFVVENKSECYHFGCNGAIAADSDSAVTDDVRNYFNFPYISREDVYKAPDWVKDTVWYEIFPERFCKGEDNKQDLLPWGAGEEVHSEHDIYRRYGGDLQGVINMLDYLKEMGFSGIYFTPIFKSPSTHKYDTTDYFSVDPDFGSNDKLKQLIDEAHKRSIKIMLDAVFNHCGGEHPFWQDVLKNGVNSKYADCFYIMDRSKPIEVTNDKEKLNYKTFGFVGDMPKWNTGNEIARDYLLKAAEFWVKEYGIDGWRLDVSNEVSHDFWRAFRQRIKTINPDVYILGENWDNSYPWLMGDQMDAVMNYEFTNPVWNFLGVDPHIVRSYTPTRFKQAIDALLTSYPRNLTANLFNLLDSHDTPRLLTVCGGNDDIALQAYAIQMTLAGSPAIYYGGEVGLDGDGHNNRKCMEWDEAKQNQKLKQGIKRLIEIRNQYDATKAVELEWIAADDDNGCIAYKKQGSNHLIYLLLNSSDTPQTLDLPKIGMVELMSNNQIDTKNITLPPHGFAILKS